jgi:carboxylesterase type B
VATQVPLKLDLQVPKTSGKKPLVVYITGGGFMLDDKSGNMDQRTYVAEQGSVVASIEYRTVNNGATYSDSVADVRSAIRYLRAHADQYDINTSEVAVWGQSAGGYLAAMTGATNGVKQFEDSGNPVRASRSKRSSTSSAPPTSQRSPPTTTSWRSKPTTPRATPSPSSSSVPAPSCR